MKKICIVGLGYIGLPTAAMFASKGFTVVGADISEKVVDELNRGKITIEEPGLDEIVKNAVESGNLKGSLTPCHADAFIISVPTPIEADKSADVSYVESATKAIVPYVKKGNIVILESTSPPGTVEELMMPILSETGLIPGEDIYLAHSPERVIPGNILFELENNDRVVGGVNEKSSIAVRDLYASIVKGNIYLTDATTAEMCKLMENTFRDVNIALANELAKICESLGINAWEVIELANKHPRVNIHQPGPGVGGHCIAVDPWFVVEKAKGLARLIHLGRNINDSMPHYVLKKAETLLGGVRGKKILIMGASYKADVDDMRESPSLELAHLLKDKGGNVVVIDPHVEEFAQAFDNIEETAKGASLIVLAVNHKKFKQIEYATVAKAMSEPNFIDTRNFMGREKAETAGFNYVLLGASK